MTSQSAFGPGNFDGSPMDNVSGITGAGPIFRSVMESAMRGHADSALGDVAHDDDLVLVDVCPLSGGTPTAACTHRISEWMPRTHAPLEACTMHEFVRIDARNGERADGCSGPSIDQKSFEIFPAEYAAWARTAHRELAPEIASPFCGGASAHSGNRVALRIASPNDGASYVLDPSRPFSLQSLAVRINAPRDARHVRLRVDGHVASADASNVVRWNLSPGSHVLVAEADGNSESAPIRVTVSDR